MFCIVFNHSFPPINCLQSTGVLSALVWSMHAMCGEVQHIQLFWTGWSQRLFVSSDPLLLLVVFYLSILASVLLLSQYSIAIFMLTALRNLLTACLPFSHGLAVHAFLHKLTPILFKPLMQEWTSTFTLSSLSLVNSGTPFLPLYFLLSTTWIPPRGEYQDTSATEIDLPLWLPLFKEQRVAGFFFLVCFLPFCCFLIYK